MNVFHLIDDILSQPRNNPIKQFERYEDIESWLRDQWAGLFKEFLSKRSSQKQIASLGAQVAELAQISQTMRRYLEEVVSSVSPGTKLVDEETQRLEKLRQSKFEENDFVKFMLREELPPDTVRAALTQSSDFDSFIARLRTTPIPSEKGCMT